MPTSTLTSADAAPPRTGFTLVELMIVIFIIGLASAAVVISLPGEERRVAAEAERLAVRLAAARDSAILAGAPVAADLRPSGYDFRVRRGGEWQAATDPALAQRSWPPGVALATGARTVLLFDVMGMPARPATLTLSGGGARVEVRIDGSGEIRVAG